MNVDLSWIVVLGVLALLAVAVSRLALRWYRRAPIAASMRAVVVSLGAAALAWTIGVWAGPAIDAPDLGLLEFMLGVAAQGILVLVGAGMAVAGWRGLALVRRQPEAPGRIRLYTFLAVAALLMNVTSPLGTKLSIEAHRAERRRANEAQHAASAASRSCEPPHPGFIAPPARIEEGRRVGVVLDCSDCTTWTVLSRPGVTIEPGSGEGGIVSLQVGATGVSVLPLRIRASRTCPGGSASALASADIRVVKPGS